MKKDPFHDFISGMTAQARAAAAEKQVVDMFLDAVRTHNREAIIEIADAVWFFKDWETRPPADKERAVLLRLKRGGGPVPGPMTISQIAWCVKFYTHRTISTENEFRALREHCRELGLKIAPSRKIRLRINKKKKRLKVLKKAA